jgi:hypothetical protein
MKSQNAKILLVLAGTATLSACSAYPRTEAEFGNSVRHMINSQAIVNGPVDTAPVETGDGQRLNGVLEALRTDVTRESSGPPPVQVTFGSGTPQQ